MFKINTLKKLVVKIRTSVKLITLIIISALIISCIFLFIYRPIYAVTLNGEFIGYSENKTKLQTRINEYMEKGECESVAFVQIEDLPKYEMCLLKKDKKTNDDDIFNLIKSKGTVYYEYYAITLEDQEKSYVSTYDNAKTVIDKLKEKGSSNLSKLGMTKKYSTEMPGVKEADTIIDELYSKPVVVSTTKYASSGTSSTYKTVNVNGSKVNLGISLIRPVSGTITSRFGYRRSGLHTGLDIGAPTGTPIKAASDGTVKYSGVSSTGYGQYVVISHSNGVETYYAHCSARYVQAGEKVKQGQVIAAVGSTGNSTGSHLHLEIRINGACQNPQNYLY